MEFKGLTSASHMSLPEAGYGSEEGYVGSEISGAVSGVTTPGASRLQASQLQQRSTAMQRLQPPSALFCAGTMPKSSCGCGALVGASEQAKREHLKSDRHKQWEKAKKTQRPLNFPKVTPVQPTEASSSSSSSSSNSSQQCNSAVQSGSSAQTHSAAVRHSCCTMSTERLGTACAS